ncbi:MAG: tetratricopeptide repeat protein [Rhodothermales bacterium]
MTRAFRTHLIVFTVSSVLLLGACNVFEGLYEEGTSEDTEVLLTDARSAIQDGRVDDAVEHLSKAHENEPDNVEVRAELASALLAQNNIDIMLIKDLADDIRLALEGGASKNAGCPEDTQCNFNCAIAKNVTPFSYKDSEAYQRLESVLAVLRQINALVQQPLTELGATPGIRFDTKEKRAELFAKLVSKIQDGNGSGNSKRIAGTLLLSAGITKLATTLAEIEQAAEERDVQLYQVESISGSTFIDYCGREVEAFVDAVMCPATSTALFTLDMLSARAENSGENALSNELLESGHELFDEFTLEVQNQCRIG